MPPRKVPKKRAAAAEPEVYGSDSDGESEERATLFAKRAKSTGGRVSSFFAPANAGGSGRLLGEVLVGQGEEERLLELAAQLPERHLNEKAAKRRRLEAQFGLWYLQWRAGNSLLFYGFGSKHDLLQHFARSVTEDGACITINGLSQGVTAKQVVVWTAAALKQTQPQHYRSYSKQELFDLILADKGQRRVYVLIHNIDGPGLRDLGGQRMLSELAALPNVHLAASADHVNTPLLWDMQTRDRFQWVWHNVTTYTPYHREVRAARLPLLLAGKSEETSKESAAVVLASLSHNAREVFRLIADQQLDPAGEQGVSRAKLFQLCRERFLVSNEMLLKQFLVEFSDHELLATKRAADGSELLHIPLAEGLLQNVLEDLDQMG